MFSYTKHANSGVTVKIIIIPQNGDYFVKMHSFIDTPHDKTTCELHFPHPSDIRLICLCACTHMAPDKYVQGGTPLNFTRQFVHLPFTSKPIDKFDYARAIACYSIDRLHKTARHI